MWHEDFGFSSPPSLRVKKFYPLILPEFLVDSWNPVWQSLLINLVVQMTSGFPKFGPGSAVATLFASPLLSGPLPGSGIWGPKGFQSTGPVLEGNGIWGPKGFEKKTATIIRHEHTKDIRSKSLSSICPGCFHLRILWCPTLLKCGIMDISGLPGIILLLIHHSQKNIPSYQDLKDPEMLPSKRYKFLSVFCSGCFI